MLDDRELVLSKRKADERQEMAAAAALRDNAAKTLGAKLKKRKADDGLVMVGSDWVRPEDAVDPLDPVDPNLVGQSVTKGNNAAPRPAKASVVEATTGTPQEPKAKRRSYGSSPGSSTTAIVEYLQTKNSEEQGREKERLDLDRKRLEMQEKEARWREDQEKEDRRKSFDERELERERLAVEKRRLDLQERER